MKRGDSFQGMRLERRLDSKKKKYRQVFLCSGNKEVIILYNRDCTPGQMCNGLNNLPLEYQWY